MTKTGGKVELNQEARILNGKKGGLETGERELQMNPFSENQNGLSYRQRTKGEQTDFEPTIERVIGPFWGGTGAKCGVGGRKREGGIGRDLSPTHRKGWIVGTPQRGGFHQRLRGSESQRIYDGKRGSEIKKRHSDNQKGETTTLDGGSGKRVTLHWNPGAGSDSLGTSGEKKCAGVRGEEKGPNVAGVQGQEGTRTAGKTKEHGFK